MGIRLPSPLNCPEAMAVLMKQCFIEEPKNRPPFSEIKLSVIHSYQEIIQTGDAMENVEKELSEVVQYSDIKMERRYLDMREHNRDFQETKNFLISGDQEMASNPSLCKPIAHKSDHISESLQY